MDMHEEFSDRFREMSDDQLIEAFNREVGKPGWVSSRAAYLTALHQEFDKRGYDYSAIGDQHKFSLSRRVRLEGKKIVLEETAS